MAQGACFGRILAGLCGVTSLCCGKLAGIWRHRSAGSPLASGGPGDWALPADKMNKQRVWVMTKLRYLSASSLCLGLLAAGVSPVLAEEADEHWPYKTFAKAVAAGDRDLLLTAFKFPVEMCVSGEPAVYPDAASLASYSLEDILGGRENVEELKNRFGEASTGEPTEAAWNDQMLFFFGASEHKFISFSYTGDGIVTVRDERCQDRMVPRRLSFCGDPLQDAMITMHANQSAWYHSSGVYENFLDHRGSVLNVRSLDSGNGGTVDFSLDGQRLDLVRTPTSFKAAPVFQDRASGDQYLVTLPEEFGQDYCEGPDRCIPVPYAYVFHKAAGRDSCDPEPIVLAEKYMYNFCPLDRIESAEIRLFTEGFINGRDVFDGVDLLKMTFADPAGKIFLRFENGVVDSQGTAHGHDSELARLYQDDKAPEGTYGEMIGVLNYGGRTLRGVYHAYQRLVFRNGEDEILALPEGDYDGTTGDLSCAEQDGCTISQGRFVLFVRNALAGCERIVLESSGK